MSIIRYESQIIRVLKLMHTKMKMDMCIDLRPLNALRRLSYKGSMSTAHLEILFLSYVIEQQLTLELCGFIRA